MFFKWLISRTVRQALAMCKHVRRILAQQRDILPPKAIADIQAGLSQMEAVLAGNPDKQTVQKEMENLERTANKGFIPYPNAAWRENIEVLLVALTVAMGVRTFFVQPFKIPTGSMQPTLYGVTSENLVQSPDFKIPTGWERIKEWFQGTSYIHIVAQADGQLQGVSRPFPPMLFHIKQTLWAGGLAYTIWFPPDYGAPPVGNLLSRAGLHPGQYFHKGDDIVKLSVHAGDHLFVDRLTYNFRPEKRGEIIVFKTGGIEEMANFAQDQGDTFYIKRLVGLSGERLSIHHDYDVVGTPMGTVPVGNLVVDGKPVTAETPHFENLYRFYGVNDDSPFLPYKENHYYGHAMQRKLEPGAEYDVRAGHLFVLGDNTLNSLDSRYWGDFDAGNVIGRSFFVYWPLTDRFGWASLKH